MREILFRGKRMRDKEWGYGYLVKLGKESFSDPERYGIAEKGVPIMGSGVCYNFKIDEVIPETRGWYTGLTDKNGKKIFEGDILKIEKIGNGLGDYYNPPLPYPVNVVVKWDLCAWMWETLCEDKRYISFPDAWCHFRCEVIGNIHDNPELLKGDKDNG